MERASDQRKPLSRYTSFERLRLMFRIVERFKEMDDLERELLLSRLHAVARSAPAARKVA